MKNLYAILSKSGRVICHQVAPNESDAVSFARMYGHKNASSAEFVRAQA